MVKLTDIQMLLTRRFGSIATNVLQLQEVAKFVTEIFRLI